MKTTKYFDHTRQRSDRIGIKWDWIESTALMPDAEKIQNDGRIRRWKKITEAGGKHLRVILLPDGETIHNAFFDRRFRE